MTSGGVHLRQLALISLVAGYICEESLAPIRVVWLKLLPLI